MTGLAIVLAVITAGILYVLFIYVVAQACGLNERADRFLSRDERERPS